MKTYQVNFKIDIDDHLMADDPSTWICHALNDRLSQDERLYDFKCQDIRQDHQYVLNFDEVLDKT